MATRIQVVIDCSDPGSLASFWGEALHYKEDDPPAGFATWEDFLRSINLPEDQWNNASGVSDPAGVGPRFYFQKVPEPKSAKNRMHVDLNVGGTRSTPLEERKRNVDAEVERLVELGGKSLGPGESQHDEYWVVMQDPEGNEFCVQ